MVKRLSKTKIFSAICCFVLGIAMVLTGAFMLNGKSNVAHADAVAPGFVIRSGAGIRYNDETPGIRFQAEVTKAQYDAWVTEYGEDQAFNFFIDIRVKNANWIDDSSKDANGYAYYPSIVTVGNIHEHNFANGNFVVSAAIFLDITDGAGGYKTAAEVYTMFGEAEFSVYSAGMFVNGEMAADGRSWATQPDYVIPAANIIDSTNSAEVTNNTARTIRSVAIACYVTRTDESMADLQWSYIIDQIGYSADQVITEDEEVFYDLAADTGTFVIPNASGDLSTAKVTVGAQELDSANYTINGNEITLTGIKDLLGAAGSKNLIVIDNGLNIYAFNNVVAATEIIYTAVRFRQVFALNGWNGTVTDISNTIDEDLNMFSGSAFKTDENHAFEESALVNGELVSKTFYSKSAEFFRGYYVLGNDIDFFEEATYASRRPWSYDGRYLAIQHSGNSGTSQNNDKAITGSGDLSGFFGFGGTFNGNGYAIKNVTLLGPTNSNSINYNTPYGIFGALAYGATVKNVSIQDVYRWNCDVGTTGYDRRLQGLNNLQMAVIASFVGSSATATENADYLTAKYGSTDAINISDIYVDLGYNTRTSIDDGLVIDPFYTDASGNYYDVPWLTNTSAVNWKGTNPNRYPQQIYLPGSFGLVYGLSGDAANLNNVVFEMPNTGITAFQNASYGLYFGQNLSEDAIADAESALTNCVLVSPTATNETAKGRVTPVYSNEYMAYEDGTTVNKYVWTDLLSGLDTGTAYDGIKKLGMAVVDSTKASNNYKVLAANDYDSVQGTLAGAKSVVYARDAEGNWTFTLPTDEVAFNTKVLRSNVNRYESVSALLTDGSSENLSATLVNLINGSQDKSGFVVTMSNQNGSSAVAKGDTVELTVTLNGVDVTANAVYESTAYTFGAEGSVNKFIAANLGSGKIKVSYGTFVQYITLTINEQITDVIYLATDKGALDTNGAKDYVVPYLEDANGDLNKTTFEALYKKYTENENATLLSIHVADANYTEQTAVAYGDGDANSSFAYDNQNALVENLVYVLRGAEGPIKLAAVNAVNLVLNEVADYKAVSQTLESRQGYYVIGQDFDANGSAEGYNKADNLLVETGNLATASGEGSSKVLGFSFGSWSKGTRRTAAADFETEPFYGKIDGLGHTVSNLEISGRGLFGELEWDDLVTYGAPSIKNAIFEDIRTSKYYWGGDYGADGTTKLLYGGSDYVSGGENVLFTFANDWNSAANYPTGVTLSELITAENVVFDMATSGYNSSDSFVGEAIALGVDAEGRSNYAISASGNPDSEYSFLAMTGHANAKWRMANTAVFKLNNVVINDWFFSDVTGISPHYSGAGAIFGFVQGIGNDWSDSIYNVDDVFYSQVSNLYVIAKSSASGRIPTLTGHYSASSPNFSHLMVAYNDFKTVALMDEDDGTVGLTLDKNAAVDAEGVIYQGYTDDEKTTWGYSFTASDIKLAMSLNSTTYTATRFYRLLEDGTVKTRRYETIADMFAAGVTQIGNFNVSATGITWAN